MRQLLSSSPSQRPSCEELLALPLLQPAVAAARDLVASKQVRRWPRWLCCLLVKKLTLQTAQQSAQHTQQHVMCEVSVTPGTAAARCCLEC